MFRTVLPNDVYQTVFDIDYLKLAQSKNTIFFDFDNTLMKWGNNSVSEDIQNLLNILKKKFSVYIITNGKGNRYKVLQSYLPKNIEVLQNMKKPNPKKFRKFLYIRHINPQDSIFIGDNLMTDIKLGNKIGCYTIKVTPTCFKEFWGTKFYRILEKLVYIFNYKYFKKLKKSSDA